MITAWGVAVTVALIGALSASVGAFLRVRALESRAEESLTGPEARHLVSLLEDELAQVRARVADVDEWRSDLNLAVAEGIKHVTRAENRIKSTVKRARAELESHGLEWGGLEAEAQDLFGDDGDGGAERAVQPVPEDVGQPRVDLSGIPGAWSPEDVTLFDPARRT